MNFLIADTFTSSLGKLTGQEQKQAKVTALDLQLDPERPGLQMHRLDGCRDPNFWSARVNQDIRIIIHKTPASFMLAYVAHHDKAYAWAERRRIEEHPRTGAIQIVEVRERVEEALDHRAASMEIVSAAFSRPSMSELANRSHPAAHPIFANLSDDQLLDIGTPADWVSDVGTWSEEQFFLLSDRLPAEVSEALLDYAATGVLPVRAAPEPAASPYEHPDTLRRVRPVQSSDALAQALEYPWDKWSVFLHPSQRSVVERDFNGPARVTGSAGTGKTIVALHRAARAVRDDPQARVLLTTFSRPLANALRAKLAILIGDRRSALDRISVASFEDAASDLFQLVTGRRPAVASSDVQQAAIQRALAQTEYADLPSRFVWNEWRHVVDAWLVRDQESYAAVPRIGRRNRLGPKQREGLWPVFETTRAILSARGLMTQCQLYASVGDAYADRSEKPFTHVVVDEAQDLGVGELQMLAAVAVGPNALFFAGDLGQRIFQQPFSWKALGVDVRGRSSSLRINYRTSRQIREAADRLLPPAVRDVDGIEDDRRGAQSVFEGPKPTIERYSDEGDEQRGVAAFILEALNSGVSPFEIGVFVRSGEQLGRARAALALAGVEGTQLSESVDVCTRAVAIGTMHFAKGLEFKAVVVLACDDDVLPLQSRIDQATDEDELREVFETERHLFYVACTRARDRLQVSGVNPVSEFFDDLT